jgi:exosortase/archaeosortase family protein
MKFSIQFKLWFKQVANSITQLPQEAKVFLGRVVLLFIVWKLLYILVLIPNEVPDSWMVKQLGKGTTAFLNNYYHTDLFTNANTLRKKQYGNDLVPVTYSTVFYKNNRKVIGIYQACDGLELMVLYAGFIICFSGFWIRKIVFIVLGIIGLFVINILRSGLLGIISLQFPVHFDFAHKYFFNLIVYGFTFLLWIFFISNSKVNSSKSQ